MLTKVQRRALVVLRSGRRRKAASAAGIGATMATMNALDDLDLIEEVDLPLRLSIKWRITEAGRKALEASDAV